MSTKEAVLNTNRSVFRHRLIATVFEELVRRHIQAIDRHIGVEIKTPKGTCVISRVGMDYTISFDHGLDSWKFTYQPIYSFGQPISNVVFKDYTIEYALFMDTVDHLKDAIDMVSNFITNYNVDGTLNTFD